MKVKTELFDFPLPERLIAQQPAGRRDASRLLVVDRPAHALEHRHFGDLPGYLRAGDCLFRNTAAVIPARLQAVRPTGGQVECLLLRPSQSLRPTGRPGTTAGDLPSSALAKDEWWCLLRPGKKLAVGSTFGRAGAFAATVREKTNDGLVRVAFETAEGDILAVANRIGEMPLPPYIHRSRSPLAGENPAGDAEPSAASRLRQTEEQDLLDRERYQTVYADRAHQVAAAAPTAGLHFTPELLAGLAAQGVAFADLTLHVGLGTFRPIATEHIEDHAIHREIYELSPATRQALFTTKGRRIAVGTTSVRSIEDYLSTHPAPPAPGSPPDSAHVAEAGIFIYPPRPFHGVDALITNFHQPRSTLLCLVAAFLTPGSTDGIGWLKEIYAEAVARDYRFLSYGDAMLIL